MLRVNEQVSRVLLQQPVVGRRFFGGIVAPCKSALMRRVPIIGNLRAALTHEQPGHTDHCIYQG